MTAIAQDQDTHNSAPLPFRAHTILGVCEGIGEDFGISPMWLRIPLAASVLVSPLWAIAAYLALGVIVFASRMVFPKPKAKALPATIGTVTTDSADQERDLPLAA